MRGGSEIITNESEVLLEGGYMTADHTKMYRFVVTRNGAGRVVINLTALPPFPPLPLPPPLPSIHLNEDDYRQDFLPVVDSRHRRFSGYNGTWWSRRMLDAAPHAGGKHQRNKRSGKKRNDKSRRSTRRHH